MPHIRKLFKTLIVPLALLLMSEAWAGQPDWLNGNSSEYADGQYLVGRGIGSTEEEAQNRARGDLATIFEVRVQVANENTTTVAQSGKNEQVNKLATQRVSAKTDKVISGITIAKIWRDPVTKDFHAFAVLSRAQAGASLREELGKIDDEVQQQIQSAESIQDSLQKIGALTHALDASIKREGFQASLKVVDPSGRGVGAPVSQATIRSQINDVLKHVQITVQVKDDGGVSDFAAILKGGVAAAGFLASSPETADLILIGKLTLNDLGRRENWNWVRATVEVSLVEKASGRVRGSKTWPVKSSAQDAQTARSRALIEVEKLFKEELRSAIIAFASS
jgi:hypothetical protein